MSSGPEYVHVMPVEGRDLAEHTASESCWCAPISHREVGGFVIVHNALDPSLNNEAIPRPQS